MVKVSIDILNILDKNLCLYLGLYSTERQQDFRFFLFSSLRFDADNCIFKKVITQTYLLANFNEFCIAN